MIEKNSVKDINREELIYSSIRGLLSTLDPHSHFLDPSHFSSMREEQSGKYYGLGISILKIEDRLTVISPIEGTPAWRLGIRPGDVITHINGDNTKYISSEEAVRKLRGPKGSTVRVTIWREGFEKPLEFSIVREEISLKSVNYYFMINSEVGYISIRNFAEVTTSEFEAAADDLKKKGMKALILDLRGNAGGPLFQAISLSDEFLPKGKLIVVTKGKKPQLKQEYYSEKDGQYEDIPLVILIDRGSASASEIVAGAMQEHERAILVGNRTWGKGLVQTIFQTSPDTALALTTAKYYTPSGRSIQRDYDSWEEYFIFYEEEKSEQQKEIKFPSKGRQVYEGGGITPDFKVKSILLPEIIVFLRAKGAFFSYANKFVNMELPISKKYGLNDITEFKRFLLNAVFPVGDEVLNDFKNYLRQNKINFDEIKFEKDKELIRFEINREILSSAGGIIEGVKFALRKDPQIKKALEVVELSKKLISS
ncbi:MAG: S41 family peptidase [Acidobacteriota bacterium]